MPTAFIHDDALILDDIHFEGDTITADMALALNFLWFKRYMSRINYFLLRQNPDATLEQLRAFIKKLYAEITLDSGDDGTDPVVAEALSIAKELITSRLISENLPVPDTIDDHAEQLLSAQPDILEQAKLRVQIRQSVTRQTIRNLNNIQLQPEQI